MLGRVTALDGLRGVAIITVMLFHFGVEHAAAGYLGVDIFFTLSGFLITALLAWEWERMGTISLRRFYGRRVLRLLPALLVVLLVWSRAVPLRDELATLSYFGNWVMALDLWPMRMEKLGQTWSLSLEEQFYVLWPVLLIFLLRWRVPRAVLVAVPLALAAASVADRFVLTAVGASQLRIYYGSDTHADGLLLGAALGLLWVNGLRLSRLYQRLIALGFIGGLVALLVQNQFPSQDPMGLLASTFVACGTAGAILLTADARPFAPLNLVLGFPPLVAVGRISYALYLWHIPFSIWIDQMHLSQPLPEIVVAKLALSFTAATLSYVLIERPALRFKARALPERFGTRVPVSIPQEVRA